LEYIRHDYDSLTFIPSGDYLVVIVLRGGGAKGGFNHLSFPVS